VATCFSCSSETSKRPQVNRPTDEYIASPSLKNIAYDSLNIVTADGVRLTGWLIRPNVALADAVVIMSGGDAGNMSFSLDYAGYMTNIIGVPILLFDYRGFGSSTAFSIDPDRLTYPEYVTDIEAAIDWTKRRHPNAKIILHGLSMGASLSLVAAARRSDVAGVIAESPYISQRTLVERINAQRQQNGSGRTVTYDGGESLDPIAHVGKLGSTPLLLIHGAKETKTPPEEARRFYDAYPTADKEMWLVPEAGHLEAMNVAGDQYVEKIKTFVSRIAR
ncbi:MAG: alpha/beta fold hydrolase, partial [bacterium]|nr:alpha/beta fold hydrolase [Candidatus Kapabacteria bacterium]